MVGGVDEFQPSSMWLTILQMPWHLFQCSTSLLALFLFFGVGTDDMIETSRR